MSKEKLPICQGCGDPIDSSWRTEDMPTLCEQCEGDYELERKEF